MLDSQCASCAPLAGGAGLAPWEDRLAMTTTDLQDIANAVIRRARQQGSVAADDVQAELTRAGEREELWKDVLALARPALSYRQGRYHYLAAVGPRLREEQQQQKVRQAVR